jgi:predicted MFS family arabinose efflux permease
MKKSPKDSHVHRRFAPTALMLGNIVTGCSVLAPAGMLPELAQGLDVSIRTAGLLITFGAVVLCIGSPLTAWLTSRIERRTLLTATLAVLALTNVPRPLRPNTPVSSSSAWSCWRSARCIRRRRREPGP